MADIKDRGNATIDTAAEKKKDLTNQEGGLMHTIKDNAESAMHSVGDFVGHARDRIGTSATKAGEKVQHWAEDAYGAGGDFTKEVTSLVRKYPIQSLLIGLGVGMIVGRVVRL